MKKNLLTLGLLSLSFMATAQQVRTHIDEKGLFFVGEGALLYNGGSLQTKSDGKLDIAGNVMIDGTSSDFVKTLNASGTDMHPGNNIVLRLNDVDNFKTSTYGQLWIDGITQSNLENSRVDKHWLAETDGSYQQMAIPFYDQAFRWVALHLQSPISKFRYSRNEFLFYNNRWVKSETVSNIWGKTGSWYYQPWRYFMFGTKSFNSENPDVGDYYVLKGHPYSTEYEVDVNSETYNMTAQLRNGGVGVNFGTNGSNRNSYNERYNTYLQDRWDAGTPWQGSYGRDIYQFGNPFFTNLDLSQIGIDTDGTNVSDGVFLDGVKGIRVDDAGVRTNANGATQANIGGTYFITFDNGQIPAGDVDKAIIKPMGTFVIKMESGKTGEINFKNLRRFKYTARATSTDYSVTANKMAFSRGATAKGLSLGSTKQLGIIAEDANGKELCRTYYVVSPNTTSGNSANTRVQVANDNSNDIGFFEEEKVNGGYDWNYTGKYWLYINEANENDFQGKPAPLAIYSSNIAKLKFEIRENVKLIPDGQHALSSGIGFYYKTANGQLTEIKQGDEIPRTAFEYGIYYGNTTSNGAGANKFVEMETGNKPVRTIVAYNPNINNYFITFDPKWKNANVKVYDMSGKLILSEDNVDCSSEYVIELPSEVKTSYVVSITADNGETVNEKIIR